MEGARSLHSNYSVKATFKNRSQRTVDLYWLDFDGKLVQYCRDMAPGEELQMFTFVTHPWVARDSVSGHWLWVSGKPVYVTPMPEGSQHDEAEDPGNGDPIPVGELEIVIHIPAYRLEDICIGFLRKHLKGGQVTDEQLSAYLMDKVSNIPKLKARIYQPDRGIVDD